MRKVVAQTVARTSTSANEINALHPFSFHANPEEQTQVMMAMHQILTVDNLKLFAREVIPSMTKGEKTYPTVIKLGNGKSLSLTHSDKLPFTEVAKKEKKIRYGNGRFGVVEPGVIVFRQQGVQNSICQYPVAVKKIDLEKCDNPNQAAYLTSREFYVGLYLQNSPNLVAPYFLAVRMKNDLPFKAYLIMELVSGANLFDLISKNVFNTLSESKKNEAVKSIFRDVCTAVHAMHSKNVIHRDIKSENIIIRKEGSAVLLDVNLSCFASGDIFATSDVGTTEYKAPEFIVKNRGATKALDIYSLAVLLHEMMTGHLHYSYEKEEEIPFKKLQFDPHTYFEEKPAPDSWQNLFIKMVDTDPAGRITIEEVLTHPWLNAKDTPHTENSRENCNTSLKRKQTEA